MNTHFTLFSNCFIVKGANRSVLCDLQKNKSVFVPNDLAEVAFCLEDKSIEEILEIYGEENKKIIIEYLDYLENNEYGFFCTKKEKKHFPKIDMEFESPGYITNAVWEIKKMNRERATSIFTQLNQLKCETIHLLFYDTLTIEDIKFIIDLSRNNTLTSIEITAKFNPSFNEEQLTKIDKLPNKIVQFIFYASDRDFTLEYGDKYLFKVIYVKLPMISNKSCGNVASYYMYVNRDKFLEAKQHNSCLNGKLSIDVNGHIKNCPSMTQSFGHIKETTLEEALSHKDFKKYWNITKDKIEVCKDCEFRYICTDCRAYLENPENEYSKPLKCGYNPYTNVWEDWSTHPLKQEAIDFYGIRELIEK